MLDRFKEFLKQKGTIKPQYIPFYLKRVSECYSFLNSSNETIISSSQKQQFLSPMEKRFEDWQV